MNFAKILILLVFNSISISCGKVDTLAIALKSVADSKPPISTQPMSTGTNLLGSWMLKNYPQKLVAYDLNFDNKGDTVYQIEVLKQWTGDCWVHAFRNCIWIMDFIFSPRTDFTTLYGYMVSRNHYEAFIQHGCPRKGTISPDFIKEQLDCKPYCIPNDSLTYLAKTVSLNYESTRQKSLQSIQNQLASLEHTTIPFQALATYAILTDDINAQPERLERLIDLIHAFHANKNYCFGIYLDIESIEHGVTLVINKANNHVEYFFADSNNMSFKGDNYTWREGNIIWTQDMSQQEYHGIATKFYNTIKHVIAWLNNPQEFDDMMVRILYQNALYEYNRQKNYNIKHYGKQNWKGLADFAVEYLEKFYTELKRHNLLNNSFYQSTYKQIYCSDIKKEQSEQKKSIHYTNLLKKIGCS